MLTTRLWGAALCLSLALLAAPVYAAVAPPSSWAQLSPEQQQALSPLSTQWDTLPHRLKHNLLHAAKGYPKLTLEKQQRFHNRLEKWSRLTPEQRKRAREKFQAFSKVPPNKRAQVKNMVREQEAHKTAGDSSPVGSAPAGSAPVK